MEYCRLHIEYILCDMDWTTIYVMVFSAGIYIPLLFGVVLSMKNKIKIFFEQRDAAVGLNPWYPREQWDPFDPMLLSEGVFAAGMIFSFLKLVHIFSINPHLGPLQVSLGRFDSTNVLFGFIFIYIDNFAFQAV